MINAGILIQESNLELPIGKCGSDCCMILGLRMCFDDIKRKLTGWGGGLATVVECPE